MSWTKTPRMSLPTTGQTTSYRDGDDAYFQAGWPGGARFVDNGDGTVYDRATGLEWVKEPGAIGGDFGSAGSPSAMTWNDAIDNCLGLTYAGRSDWRLPNAMELLTLVNFGDSSSPTVYSAFPDPGQYTYWSSTPLAVLATDRAMVVEFDSTYQMTYALLTATHYVRPVRGGRLNA